jgi:hypothetical protein
MRWRPRASNKRGCESGGRTEGEAHSANIANHQWSWEGPVSINWSSFAESQRGKGGGAPNKRASTRFNRIATARHTFTK